MTERMTGKRFTMCHEQNDINGWTMSIVDWQTKQPFDYTTYEVHSSSITDTKDEMEDLCLLLNELHDENTKLKTSNEFNKHLKERYMKDSIALAMDYKKMREDLQQFYQTLDDMIETERTELGRSVLKQFKEAIK